MSMRDQDENTDRTNKGRGTPALRGHYHDRELEAGKGKIADDMNAGVVSYLGMAESVVMPTESITEGVLRHLVLPTSLLQSSPGRGFVNWTQGAHLGEVLRNGPHRTRLRISSVRYRRPSLEVRLQSALAAEVRTNFLGL